MQYSREDLMMSTPCPVSFPITLGTPKYCQLHPGVPEPDTTASDSVTDLAMNHWLSWLGIITGAHRTLK